MLRTGGPLRHLFVSQEFPPETGWGGIGTYVGIITEALAATGADVHVLSVVPDQPPSQKMVGGVTVHRQPLPVPRGSGRLPPESWRRTWLPLVASRLVRKLQIEPDVVECPEWCAEGLALGLLGSAPLVVRMHSGARQLFGYTRQGQRWRGLDGRMAMRLEERSVRQADVVTATRSVMESLAGPLRLDEAATRTITYPVRPAHEVPPFAADGPPTVTFLGRFEPRKGPDVVLAAAPYVLAEVPQARFAFVGVNAGALHSADWLRSEAQRLGVGHAVEVREEFGRHVVERELEQATVCVVPSRWESFGYTAAEAMVYGRPVVASAIPALRDVLGDGEGGRIVGSEDPQEWASELCQLLASPELAREVGAAGRNRIETVNNPARVARETQEAHQLAVERAHRRGRRRLTRGS